MIFAKKNLGGDPLRFVALGRPGQLGPPKYSNYFNPPLVHAPNSISFIKKNASSHATQRFLVHIYIYVCIYRYTYLVLTPRPNAGQRSTSTSLLSKADPSIAFTKFHVSFTSLDIPASSGIKNCLWQRRLCLSWYPFRLQQDPSNWKRERERVGRGRKHESYIKAGLADTICSGSDPGTARAIYPATPGCEASALTTGVAADPSVQNGARRVLKRAWRFTN